MREMFFWNKSSPGATDLYEINEETKTWYANKDREDNSATFPPSGLTADLACYWAIEFFLPSHTEQLIVQLRALGWDHSRFPDQGGDKPSDWLKHFRGGWSAGGSVNLGYLAPDPPGSLGGLFRKIILPEEMKVASCQMLSLTRAITCIVVCFTPNDHCSDYVNSLLRDKYKTRITPTSNGYSASGVRNEKRAAINNSRSARRDAISRWFSEHLPGSFSESSKPIPTCELLLINRDVPNALTAHYNSRVMGDFYSFLGLDQFWGGWKVVGYPGMAFYDHGSSDDKHTGASYFTWYKDEAIKKNIQGYGEGDDRFGAYAESNLRSFIPKWATTILLKTLEDLLAETRDSLLSTSPSDTRYLVGHLTKLITQSIDLNAIVPELRELPTNKLFAFDGLEAAMDLPCGSGKTIYFSTSIEQAISDKAQRVWEIDAAMRPLLLQCNSLISVSENRVLQKHMRTLGVVTVFATLLSLAIAIISLQTTKPGNSHPLIGEEIRPLQSKKIEATLPVSRNLLLTPPPTPPQPHYYTHKSPTRSHTAPPRPPIRPSPSASPARTIPASARASTPR